MLTMSHVPRCGRLRAELRSCRLCGALKEFVRLCAGPSWAHARPIGVLPQDEATAATDTTGSIAQSIDVSLLLNVDAPGP